MQNDEISAVTIQESLFSKSNEETHHKQKRSSQLNHNNEVLDGDNLTIINNNFTSSSVKKYKVMSIQELRKKFKLRNK